MSTWGSAKARKVLKALLAIGWSIKRHKGGSHRVLERSGFPDFVFAFHDGEENLKRAVGIAAKRQADFTARLAELVDPVGEPAPLFHCLSALFLRLLCVFAAKQLPDLG